MKLPHCEVVLHRSCPLAVPLNKCIQSSTFLFVHLFCFRRTGRVSLDERPLNDLSGPIQRHLMWSIHLYRPPSASDVYWLTWQGLSIGLSPLSSNCLSLWRACACPRTALASVHVQADTASAVTDSGNWFGLLRPVDPVSAVSLITIDKRLRTNPWGQFPQLHKRASGGPLVAKSLNKPMHTHKHTLICTAAGETASQPQQHPKIRRKIWNISI